MVIDNNFKNTKTSLLEFYRDSADEHMEKSISRIRDHKKKAGSINSKIQLIRDEINAEILNKDWNKSQQLEGIKL